jgi:sigma-E factor negative regulatory protein RseC
MLRETGRVVAIEDDGVWVETIRSSTCSACAANKGCGHGLINRYSGGRGLVRALPGEKLAPRDCRVDDQVIIELPEEVILRGSVIVYLVPLLGLLCGALAMAGQGGDGPVLAGAAAGLALGLALVRWHARRHRNDRRLQPALLEIVSRGAQPLSLT